MHERGKDWCSIVGERVKNQVRKLLDCYVKISIREEGGGEEEKGKDADVRSDRIFKFRDSFFLQTLGERVKTPTEC